MLAAPEKWEGGPSGTILLQRLAGEGGAVAVTGAAPPVVPVCGFAYEETSPIANPASRRTGCRMTG